MKKRGTTRGLMMAKNRVPRDKMVVTAPAHVGRFVGKNATRFVTEIGVTVRTHAPIHIHNWTSIHSELKSTMIESLKVTYINTDDMA